MNKLKVIFANALVLLLLSNTAIATSISSYEVLPTEKGFLLTANTLGEGTISIKIVSNNDEKIFAKSLKTEKCFRQNYNLKDFETGLYFLVIEDEVKVMKQPFEIQENEIQINADLKSTAYKPNFKFNLKEERLSLNWLKSNHSDFELTIKNEKSQEFFEDNLENEQIIHRNYDFSNLPNGTYYITVTDGQYSYHEVIELR